MNEKLSKNELLGILGYIDDEKREEVEGFCVSNSSHEDFECAWQESRKLRKKNPHYYEEVGYSRSSEED